MRGDITETPEEFEVDQFQSTPLCEGRHGWYVRAFSFGVFQSTPLCEGRPEHMLDALENRLFQSTPLCEGRQCRAKH